MLSTQLVSVKKITTTLSLTAEGMAKAEEMSHLIESIGGAVQPLILVTTASNGANEFKLAIMSDEQAIILQAARILRERNLRAGEMINAYLVNTYDHYRPELLQMGAMLYPGAPVVSISKVVDYRPDHQVA